MSFLETSKSVAQEFIQSLVFVDDRASFNNNSDEIDLDDMEILEPTTADAIEALEEDNINKEYEKTTNVFNAKTIIDSFSNHGIVASIIKPEKSLDEKIITNVVKLSKVVDVVVLDIDIENDEGKTAKEIFSQIIIEKPRLKLIVFYSGAGRATISEFSFEIMQKVKEKNGYKLKDFVYQIEKTRIVILSKEGVGSEGVKFEDLPEKIFEEFASISQGIISNAVLKALALIKKNTHQILNNLDVQLDAPFLSHRAWLPTPNDSENFLLELISSELFSIVSSNLEVRKHAGIENICDYLLYKNSDRSYSLQTNQESPNTVTFDVIKTILTNGLSNKESINNISSLSRISKNKLESSYKNFTKTFCFQNENHEELDHKFSTLTTLNTYINTNNAKMQLTLGTLVKKGYYDFLVCIQPKCDSVRIRGKQKFIFLKLSVNKTKFDFIILDDESKYKNLKISNSVSDIVTYEFLPNELGYITSTNIGGKQSFRGDNKVLFTWIGQLKDSFAQHIVQEYASKLSRIGLDPYEWLRRNA